MYLSRAQPTSKFESFVFDAIHLIIRETNWPRYLFRNSNNSICSSSEHYHFFLSGVSSKILVLQDIGIPYWDHEFHLKLFVEG
jgi:hypothetical protein